MLIIAWVIMTLAGLFGWAWLTRWLLENPRQDAETGLLYHLARAYVNVFHRCRVTGLEHVPAARSPGPLIVVANHTAGVDPVLVQAACPFEIRWIMAEDMRHPWGEPLWAWARVIFVNRDRGDTLGLRAAIRHVRGGGVLGIFPEGGLERPPRSVLPFNSGVGLVAIRTGAPVLPVVIDGTPQFDPAWASLHRPGRARVRFLQPVTYAGTVMDASAVARDLRRRFLDATGWPANDDPGAVEQAAAAAAHARYPGVAVGRRSA